MFLRQDSECISVGLKSNTYCNGNFIMKEINLLRKKDDIDSNSCSWQLKVCGINVDLSEVLIDNEVRFLNKKSLKNILHTVECLELCRGFQHNDCISLERKLIVQEKVTVNECSNSSSKLHYRSELCEQVVSFISQSQSFLCKKCQKLKLNIEAKTEKETNRCDNNKENVCCNIQAKGDDHPLSYIKEHLGPRNLSEKSTCDKDEIFVSESDHADIKYIGICFCRQLRPFKNCIPQAPGISDTTLRWIYESAKGLRLPPNGWVGGLHHDETKEQQYLVMEMKDCTPIITGLIDLGEEAQNLTVMKDQAVTQRLASEVIQITFVGFTGFRFPIFHFPTGGIKVSELSIIPWNVIEKLSDWGFQIDYIMQDGGEENRSFMNLHFNGNPRETCHGSPNLVYPLTTIFHTQDFSHNIKKLRNSILKSGDFKGVHTRKLTLHGNFFLWKQWKMAVEWDRTMNARRLHHKVTDSHLHPTIKRS